MPPAIIQPRTLPDHEPAHDQRTGAKNRQKCDRYAHRASSKHHRERGGGEDTHPYQIVRHHAERVVSLSAETSQDESYLKSEERIGRKQTKYETPVGAGYGRQLKPARDGQEPNRAKHRNFHK